MQKIQDFLEQHKIFVGGAAVALGAVLLYAATNEKQEPKRYIDPSIKVVPLGDRLGGEMAVKAITNRFFDLLTNDKQLAQFFIGTDKKQIKAHLQTYLIKLFGGEAIYQGRSLKEAHSKLPLTEQHFEIALNHLKKTLTELGIDNKEVEDAQAAFIELKSSIVSK